MLKYSHTKYYLGVFIPLLLSGLICLMYRSSQTYGNLFFEEWFHINIHQNSTPNYILIYNLPAGLWVFSTALLSLDFRITLFRKRNLSVVYLPLVFVIGLEVLQYFNITDGTFDFLDILIPSLFWLTAFFLLRINKVNEKISYSRLNLFAFEVVFLMVVFADTYTK